MHQAEATLQAPPDAVADEAVRWLSAQGFRVQRGDATVVAYGPRLNSSRESPLRGAGEVRLTFEPGRVRATADLAGTRFLSWFATLFPTALIVALLGVQALVNPGAWGVLAVLAVTMVPLWLVLGPLMGWWLRKRTRDAFDVFVHNLGQVRGAR